MSPQEMLERRQNADALLAACAAQWLDTRDPIDHDVMVVAHRRWLEARAEVDR